MRLVEDDKGSVRREMVTKSDVNYIGRIDSILDEDNPGVMEADLGKLLTLLKETK